ncbi:low temperature requirement protein A [Streptomyces longwoodensis]|uniref:low temperature requirement protein A n=1 Tax=Streptomyces longwoodensis TaxID=68231 RepID=UPI0022512F53|nr:low temperature requirement protein A [Streptomyces longwoodensis]MCX4997647.1 low temperature requirement protein A [Streptomyces longwoodensis]
MQRTSSLPLVPPAGARHASWLELFFDLVAVAGVAQLARLLQGGPDARDVAVYAVLFAAFWTAWISNTLYGDVAAEKTRTRTLLLGMFGLTVMAAAVHGVQEGEHARAFALAYVVARLFANRVWQQRHQRVEGWPAARLTVGVAPWIASLWAVEERARLWLWTVGLLLDLVITLAVPVGRRIRHGVPASRRPPSRQHHGAAGPVPVTTAHLDDEHLAERLGLLILIVLGEGVHQLVEAASDTPWDRDLHLTAPAAFLTLTLLWSLCLRRGHGGVPFLPPALRSPPPSWPCTAAPRPPWRRWPRVWAASSPASTGRCTSRAAGSWRPARARTSSSRPRYGPVRRPGPGGGCWSACCPHWPWAPWWPPPPTPSRPSARSG